MVKVAALARTKATHKAKGQPGDQDHHDRDQDQCQVVAHAHGVALVGDDSLRKAADLIRRRDATTAPRGND